MTCSAAIYFTCPGAGGERRERKTGGYRPVSVFVYDPVHLEPVTESSASEDCLSNRLFGSVSPPRVS